MRIFSLFGMLLLSIVCSAQNNNLYIFEHRYTDPLKELDAKTSFNLKPIVMLGQYMVDPSRKGDIRYDLVDKYIDRLYPDKNVSGLLCVNLEGELFSQLKNNNKESRLFEVAQNKYIQLAVYIKRKLPNVKFGFYGLPFKGYYEFQLEKNSKEKLDSLLKHVDVLFPSLYIAYPAKQKSLTTNLEYLRRNLDIAFSYGTRLGKPVYPFFWYLIHPANKKYGSSLIPKEEFFSYLGYINTYKFKDQQISGIVWWDTPTPYNTGKIKFSLVGEDKKHSLQKLDEVFKYYLF